MRYLCFDIECCDGKHICEFGYVIADEHFNVTKKEVFIINPEEPFNLTGRPHQDDLVLFYPEETYYAGERFPFYYNRIKDLLLYEDQIVIGHAVDNDARFLRTACKKYKLEPINFPFFDSQRVYGEYSNKKSISLENAEDALQLQKPAFLHKSDEDALLTLQMMQKLCNLMSMTLPDLQVLCPKANGNSYNFNIMYTGDSLVEMLDALSKNIDALSNSGKKRCFSLFAKKVKPQGAIVTSLLTGSQICFSPVFERNNLKEALVLIQLFANHGCRYNTKVSEDNYYVATDEELAMSEVPEHFRYASALNHSETCKVITFQGLFSMLSTTEQEVKSAPWPSISRWKNKGKSSCSSVTVSSTIGDQLKSKGVDISKLVD